MTEGLLIITACIDFRIPRENSVMDDDIGPVAPGDSPQYTPTEEIDEVFLDVDEGYPNDDVEARARFYLGAAYTHLSSAWRTLKQALEMTRAAGIQIGEEPSREDVEAYYRMSEVTKESKSSPQGEPDTSETPAENKQDVAVEEDDEAQEEDLAAEGQPGGIDIGHVARIILYEESDEDGSSV